MESVGLKLRILAQGRASSHCQFQSIGFSNTTTGCNSAGRHTLCCTRSAPVAAASKPASLIGSVPSLRRPLPRNLGHAQGMKTWGRPLGRPRRSEPRAAVRQLLSGPDYKIERDLAWRHRRIFSRLRPGRRGTPWERVCRWSTAPRRVPCRVRRQLPGR